MMSTVAILWVLAGLMYFAFVGFVSQVLRLKALHRAEVRMREVMREPAPKRLPRRIVQPARDRNEYT